MILTARNLPMRSILISVDCEQPSRAIASPRLYNNRCCSDFGGGAAGTNATDFDFDFLDLCFNSGLHVEPSRKPEIKNSHLDSWVCCSDDLCVEASRAGLGYFGDINPRRIGCPCHRASSWG